MSTHSLYFLLGYLTLYYRSSLPTRRSSDLWLVALAYLALGQEAQDARLMRFPDIYKDKVVFMYGGDLWLASTSGGVDASQDRKSTSLNSSHPSTPYAVFCLKKKNQRAEQPR